MNPEPENYRMKLFERIMKYAGIMMALIYVAAGITVLLRSHSLFILPNQYAVPLGLCLIGYGAFRGYRLYQKYFQKST